MNSNMVSRLLPGSFADRSIYEDMRQYEDGSDTSDIEAQGGVGRDTNEAGLRFPDYEYDQIRSPERTPFLRGPAKSVMSPAAVARQSSKTHARSPQMTRSPRLMEEEADDDVPASLLIEDDEFHQPGIDEQISGGAGTRHHAVPGPSTRDARSKWEAVQHQQQLHHEDSSRRKPPAGIPRQTLAATDPREKALWMWANVINLDQFVGEVYEYFTGGGLWCICLGRLLNLLTQAFVAVFITFLTQCIDYSKVPHSKKMDEILIPQCTRKMSGMPNLVLWLFAMYWIWNVFRLFIDSRRLIQMQNFYTHLLRIPESDMQTISWQEVVARLMALRDANVLTMERRNPSHKQFLGSQSKERLDAHDIANRLMRRENYLIALFNKDILDLRLPIPFLQDRQLFSRTLEWNLHYCILDFIFTEQGQVRQLVLKESHRKRLSAALRGRFLFAGFMNVICAPVIFTYCLLVYFFKYFNEYQQNPSSIGARQYTPLAEWKFREFNELPHLFNRRINMSYPFASRYLEQFPRFKTVQLSKFVSFVAGALLSVLAIASLVDPDLFLGFEITHDRTVLFYVGVLGAIWAGARGSIPDDNVVFDPEYALRNVLDYIHYSPEHWKRHLHSDEVKREFSELYKMRILIFLEELLSIIFTPFVLWFSLPNCSDQIIDFFREFTIHVDGLGYVCSFAVFDFKKGAAAAPKPGSDLREDYYSTRNGKLAASFYGFMDNYVTNPKTGIPGHVPPGSKYRFQPPPAFPSMMSPTLAPEMASSRMGRSQRGRSHAPPALTTQQSLLLDPHHQPSSSGFGAKSVHGRMTRSRYQGRSNIPEQDEEAIDESQQGVPIGQSSGEYGYLDGTRWETSPTREGARVVDSTGVEDAEDGGEGNKAGVLDLLYQFQRAQTDGRGPAANI